MKKNVLKVFAVILALAMVFTITPTALAEAAETPIASEEPAPSAEPTAEPTTEPSAEPSPSASPEPTAEPPSPSASPEPTAEPTIEPTVEPSPSPSAEPSPSETPIVIPVEKITVIGFNGLTKVGVGAALQMNAAIEPETATDKMVTWSVINSTGEAAIDENGLLTGVKEGTVTVKATANDESGVYGEAEIAVEMTSAVNAASDFTYTVNSDNTTATITGYTGTDTAITIPSVIDNYTVTRIGDSAFSGKTTLISITIPSGVTSIGDYAFSGCSGLTSLSMPAGATIQQYSFFSCTNIESVTLTGSGAMPNYTYTTYQYTPWYISRSKCPSITIASGVTSIGDYAFSGCTWLTSFNIPSGVTSIGNSAFRGCSGLTSITIPDRVTSIGNSTFYGCSGLTSITIPNTSVLASIGDNAFSGCSGLTSIMIPSGVTSIGGMAFDDCSGLTDITIPDSVTGIGGAAFSGCTRLTSITIPNSVTSIGDYAFKGCTGLANINIPNSVTGIWWAAFYGCSKLTSIKIPNGVQYIDGKAFYGCSRLAKINIPDSVVSIGSEAFRGCKSLTNILVPNSVTNIGREAFQDCPYIVVSCLKNSKAYRYCAHNGIPYRIVGGVEEVQLNKTVAKMDYGTAIKLKATVLPADVKNKAIKWTSSNPNVATVNSSGKVKAVGYGRAVITAMSADGLGTKATCSIKVNKIVGTVTLNKTAVKMNYGTAAKLKATVITAPSTQTAALTWSSSNPKVVTVSSTGKIKAVGRGKAVVTVTAKGVDGSSVKAACTVKVNNVIAKVTLNQTAFKMTKGTAAKLKAAVATNPAKQTCTLTWTSSNPKVATVSASGKVKAKSSGKAVITVVAKGADGSAAKATCVVKVK